VRQSLAALFQDRVAQSGEAVAVRFKEGKEGYKSMSWSEFGQLVEDIAFGLVECGVQPGECTALMANTSHHWVAADVAILNAGAASVPIYPTSSSKDIEHIINNSGAGILFVHNEALLLKVLKVHANLPGLRKIILVSPPRKKSIGEIAQEHGIAADTIVMLDEVREIGRKRKEQNPDEIKNRVAQIKPEDLATIIYTSGTTGTPKGVMLLNSTVMAVVQDLPGVLPIGAEDTYLSFLPLSHVFERVCGEFYWLLNGSAIAFAEGMEHLPKNIQEVQPTIMLVVPRLLEKIYAKVMSGIQGASPRAQKLIRWALSVGREVVWHRAEGKPIRAGLEAKHWVAEKLVFKKLRERIGSNLRIIVSGGAPGTPEVLEFFNAVGISVLEGYGLTETAAPTNVNRIHKNKVGTVGPKLPSVEVKIAEDGEILFKGPSIFSGYFKDEEHTKEAFTEGWFHTGDIGVIDRDGYLKITDRKKDLIVNSAGKNIAPQKIESILRTVPFVSQAVVFGDKKKTLVALLTVEEQPAMEFAKERGWQANSFEELTQLTQFKRYIKNEIAERSHHLADYEQVRNFAILPHELSVENGELTATMKIKRNVLKQRYAELVEGLYREDNALVSSR
jgi:long-chain acyl-CoA synthetase